jgi:alanine racemase
VSSHLPPGIRPCWAEVSLSRLEQNLHQIRRHVGAPRVDVCCVVKANAYGHGAVPVSQCLQNLGVRRFAVATVEEGIELRDNGIDSEILVFCGVPASQERLAADNQLTVSIHSLEECSRLVASGTKMHAHLDCNTGMNRLGLSAEALAQATPLLSNSKVEVAGVYSHFSSADDPDESFSRQQIERFVAWTQDQPWGGRHLANSAGLRFPEAWFNFVRVGIILYGYNPVPSKLPIEVKPVLSWKVSALQIETVPAETPISYSRTYVTRRPARVATLAAGYADGFSRKLSNAGYVMAKGKICRILGTVTMDMTVVDVTEVEADLGTEFAIINDQRNAADLAADLGTIPYEVLCSIGGRVPRIYV